MVLKNLLISDKCALEKIRIIRYRLRKKRYMQKKMVKKNSKVTKYHYFTENLFFFNEKSIQTYCDNYKHAIISESDRILGNEYRDISGGYIKIGERVDWNKDYIFDHKWELKHYSRYILKDKKVSTDVKHVWELSRFYHLVVLAQAYQITNNEDYVEKIIDDVFTWSEQNPINNSVNWTVSMEVSIRVVNLIQALSLVRKSNSFNKEMRIKLNELIYMHGVYVWNNLEKGLSTNNHYLSNLVGLIWIGVYFKGSKLIHFNNISKKYLKFAFNQLIYELQYQINDDGFSYEDSVSYHGLNTEMILLTLNILEKNNISYPIELKMTATRMVEALQKLLINQKHIPLIGDVDNGRLIICNLLSNSDKTNFSYLIKIAKEMCLLKESELLHSPVLLSTSGIYRVFNKTFDIIIKCGRIGLNGLGGHAHNDQLSLVLNIHGEQIIVDPGTGYYSGDYELRRLLRSTDSHSTLFINNYEQNDIDIGMFKMIERTNSETLEVNENTFEGRHFGYLDTHGIEYIRKIKLYQDNIVILDSVSRLIEKEAFINFIFDDNVTLMKIDETNVEIKKNGLKVLLSIEGGTINILDQYISKSYGKTKQSNKVRITMESKNLKSIIRMK
ncbi:alginate lyase family protein [Sutcliffiella horikoshii]|uniref:heparinase II/III family protein n=1 Tax=Sutcliffiella horikoshii TaxID=79883 RepID=UPI00384C200A